MNERNAIVSTVASLVTASCAVASSFAASAFVVVSAFVAASAFAIWACPFLANVAVADMQPPFAGSAATAAWFTYSQRQRAKEAEKALQRDRGSDSATQMAATGAATMEEGGRDADTENKTDRSSDTVPQ